jgi:hypothetical protein
VKCARLGKQAGMCGDFPLKSLRAGYKANIAAPASGGNSIRHENSLSIGLLSQNLSEKRRFQAYVPDDQACIWLSGLVWRKCG